VSRIVAYTYEADVHCPDCAAHRAFVGLLARTPPLQMGTDEHGLAFDLIDREGNPVRPVFSTDERDTLTHCGDCMEELS
jgi:hypothetical protein